MSNLNSFNKILSDIKFNIKLKVKSFGSSQEDDDSYFTSPGFLRDMRRALEKGAEEQDKIMKRAEKHWKNQREMVGKK